MNIQDIKPVMEYLEKTERSVSSQDYTYNDIRLTYNSDVNYGGIYGKEGNNPIISIYDYKP